MDVLEKSYPPKDLLKVMKILKFGNNPVQLVGSSSMASQYYPSDFDMISNIEHKTSPTEAYKELNSILERIENEHNLFFIELKLEQINRQKYKFFKAKDFTESKFMEHYNENTKLCKIDCIYNMRSTFKEASIIYFFNYLNEKNKDTNVDDYQKSLLNDQREFYQEKYYYKSLKRLLNAARLSDPPDKGLIILLSSLFNSETGKLYQLKNELDAGIMFIDRFKDTLSKKKVRRFLNHIGMKSMNVEDMPKVSQEFGNLINKEAKDFYKLYKIPVGRLPKYNSIK